MYIYIQVWKTFNVGREIQMQMGAIEPFVQKAAAWSI